MKLSEYQRSRSFFDLGQRSLRFQSLMFDFWLVYSGERFRASWPSWLGLFWKGKKEHLLTEEIRFFYITGKSVERFSAFCYFQENKQI